ncbi:hypothetical protein BFP72_12825 [Reichenbachiella sp. 5M10]|uniref:carbohydrate-binding protein n=1 Tax=Reichenbachiella sp. 5M10 TaxID=1889772 RepID=UPI000C656EED|nr:carbohydrate-binding protein [Reichenbachiella sp. 5M10]PIB36210.1 hypothetical protein BFP72_12825 [Reichenbachiella sp. 5M10]
MSLNKQLDVVTIEGNPGFRLGVDGIYTELGQATLDESNPRILHITNTLPLIDTHQLTLSYSGTQIQATDGSFLQEFSELPVDNHLPVYTVLPAKIEAENYITNIGLVHENTTDAGGGENLGHTATGDYVDYHVTVQDTTVFQIDARVASESAGGTLELQQLNENNEIIQKVQLSFGPTGGWQTWTTVSTSAILYPYRGTLRIKVIAPEFNLNWIRFSKTVLSTPSHERSANLQLYPNPTRDEVQVEIPNEKGTATLSLTDLNGRVWRTESIDLAHPHPLSIHGLSSGAYIVEIRSSHTTWRQRLLIN